MDPTAIRELHTVIDFVRYGASRFVAHDLAFGHGYDNAVDEALALVRHVLHLTPEAPQEFYGARLTSAEKEAVAALFRRRITR